MGFMPPESEAVAASPAGVGMAERAAMLGCVDIVDASEVGDDDDVAVEIEVDDVVVDVDEMSSIDRV